MDYPVQFLSEPGNRLFLDTVNLFLPNESFYAIAEYKKGLLVLTNRRLVRVEQKMNWDYKKGHSAAGIMSMVHHLDMIVKLVQEKKDRWTLETKTPDHTGYPLKTQGRTPVVQTASSKIQPSDYNKKGTDFNDALLMMSSELASIIDDLKARSFSKEYLSYVEVLQLFEGAKPEWTQEITVQSELDSYLIPGLFSIIDKHFITTRPGYQRVKDADRFVTSDVIAVTNSYAQSSSGQYLPTVILNFNQTLKMGSEYIELVPYGDLDATSWQTVAINQPWIIADVLSYMNSERMQANIATGPFSNPRYYY